MSRMFLSWLILPLLLIALFACSSKENTIKPAPLPKFEKKISIDKVWTTSLGKGIGEGELLLKPALTEETVYGIDYDGVLIAIDRKTGKKNWQKKTGEQVVGGLYAAYGKLIFSTENGEVVAVGSSDGAEIWRTQLSSEVLAVVDSNGDLLAAQTTDDKLFALSLSDGSERWVFDITPPALTLRGSGQPQIHDDIVIAGFSNGKLIAISLGSGAVVWERRIADPSGRSELDRLVDIDGGFTIDSDVIYVVAYQGRIAEISLKNGRPAWQRDMSSHVQLATGFGQVYVSDSEGIIWALDQSNGNTVWTQNQLKARELTGVVTFKNYIVVGDFEGYLHWISQVDGSIVARKKIDGAGFASSPVVFDGTLYSVGKTGKLVALQIEE